MEANAQLLLFVCFFWDLNLGEDMTSWNHTSICKFGILHHWPGILVDLICTCKTIHQHETWIWSKEENTRENTPNQSEGLFLDFKWNGTYSSIDGLSQQTFIIHQHQRDASFRKDPQVSMCWYNFRVRLKEDTQTGDPQKHPDDMRSRWEAYENREFQA